MQRYVIAKFADDRFDDHVVTGQTLLDDLGGSGAETTPSSSQNWQARFSR